LRHAATDWNLERPARLQGRRQDRPLAALGMRQAEVTRDFLAVRPIDVCYCSPMRRAMQTANIVAGAHGLTPLPVDDLTECDVGRWEGRTWSDIRAGEADEFRRYMNDPVRHGYPGGENFKQVRDRAERALEKLLHRHDRPQRAGRIASRRQSRLSRRFARPPTGTGATSIARQLRYFGGGARGRSLHRVDAQRFVPSSRRRRVVVRSLGDRTKESTDR